MINRQFNKVISAFKDHNGDFDVEKSLQFEVRYLEVLSDRMKKYGINNAWRSDKKLHTHIKHRIKQEIQSKKETELLKMTRWFKGCKLDDIDKHVKKKAEEEDDVEIISSIPDKGTCVNYWNPFSYELDLDQESIVEFVFKEMI